MVDETNVARKINGEAPTGKGRRGILLWSTPESAAEGRITVLACVETLIAVSVTAYIAWRTGSLLYIAVPASVAPLLLLRTPYSTEVGLTLWDRYGAWWGRVGTWYMRARASRSFLWYLSVAPLLLVSLSVCLPALACRIAATAVAILRHPIRILYAIPENWWRVALATDLHHPPEMVAGIERGDIPYYLRFTERWSGFQKICRKLYDGPSDSGIHGAVGCFLLVVFSLIGAVCLTVWFVPTLLYRWSLKSTTVVYFPLLWAAFKSRRGKDTATQRLETIATDQAERLVRWYAGFVLIVLTVLPAIFAAPLQPYISAVQGALGIDLVDFWLFTGQIKLWHVARGINAGITIGLFLFADKALRRIKRGRAHSDELVHRIIGACRYVRSFLGVYLAAKLLHVVVTSVEWSSVDWRIIPW